MQSLSALAPVANANPFPPITRADLVRAAMWKLKLPDAPLAVEAVKPATAENLRDSWPASVDADVWTITPEPALVAEPATVKLAIHGFTYEAREIPAGECGTVAYEVLKIETNNRYAVIRNHFGEVTCDCPDYVLRQEGTGRMCKHGVGVVEAGLVPTPTPAPTAGRGRATPPTVSNIEATPARRRRFEPSPDEMAEAAQLFGDLAADRVAYRRELAAGL